VPDGEAGVGIGLEFTTGLAVEEDVLGEGDSIDERPWLARVEGKSKVVGRGKKKVKSKRKEEMFFEEGKGEFRKTVEG
jgi:transcriptional activator SPT7